MPRRMLFWLHLGCGVVAGLVILMMSVTGALLTYERQLVAAAERGYRHPPEEGQARKSVDELVAAASAVLEPTALSFAADPLAPVIASAGREGRIYLNPYSGEVLGTSASAAREFFSLVTRWHRWFGVEGEQRQWARAITGASNLAFLVLIVSGCFLWLPRVWAGAMFRSRLFFSRQAMSGKARDYNWHHVLGIWSALPLAVIVASAVVFSYPWANVLVYRSLGEQPPERGARRGGPIGPTARATAHADHASSGQTLTLDALLAQATGTRPGWRTITLALPRQGTTGVGFTIDAGTGGQPQKRETLVLDAASGAVVRSETFASQSPGTRTRSLIRFLHTGEALGIVGQTLAGAVSLTSILMVWTGLALAYRRLVAPWFRRR